MKPTLEQGSIVVANKMRDPVPGDIIAVYYENRILVSRLIGLPGDRIFIDGEGVVSVNDRVLPETYISDSNKAFGITDLTYPYQIPDGCYFVMGDNRNVAIDSRMSVFGCINKEYFVGKIIFCVWPLQRIGHVG